LRGIQSNAVDVRTFLDLALILALLGLVGPVSADAVYKCREGERILYQSAPCPPGYEALTVAPPATDPDPAAQAQARAQAKAELAAAERLRRREAREEAERRARAAESERLASTCARRLEVIRMLESADGDAPAERKKAQRRAINERKAYILQCGPLPR
jgi:hypothetical protein